MQAAACAACGTDRTEVFFESRLGWGVRSDWAPVPRGTVLLRCTACGHLFKDADLVAACSDYVGYQPWQGTARTDKVEFAGDRPTTRSHKVIDHLRATGVLHDGDRVLDVGCSRGVFLDALGGSAHAGFEVSEHYRPILERKGFRFYSPERPPAGETFDVVTLIHVAEHLMQPAEDLRLALSALKPGGRLVIQVPDPLTQPTDAYVMDHRSHFLAAVLEASFRRLDVSLIDRITGLLGGEATAIFDRTSRPARHADEPTDARPVREALVAGEERLLSLKRDGGSVVVHGAGLLGTLVASVLGDQVTAFSDDDPASWGNRLLDRPVTPPDQLPPGTRVVVAVPPMAAGRVHDRVIARRHEALATFLLPERPAEILT